MTDRSIDPQTLDALKTLARTSALPFGQMSMDQIAEALGMTRMTLYRKAGSRQRIVDALIEEGIDVRGEPQVRERVIAATVDLLRHRPISELTLDLVAERAGCSLPAIHARFGGRQGVLKSVFEQHSPLIPVEQLVSGDVIGQSSDLWHDVRMLYGTVFDLVTREWPLLRAFLAEVLRDPDSEVGSLFREWYVPRATGAIVPIFQRHLDQGTIRPLPLPLIVQMFVAPLGLHVSTRDYVTELLHVDLPDRERTVSLLTDMFCRAVAPEEEAP